MKRTKCVTNGKEVRRKLNAWFSTRIFDFSYLTISLWKLKKVFLFQVISYLCFFGNFRSILPFHGWRFSFWRNNKSHFYENWHELIIKKKWIRYKLVIFFSWITYKDTPDLTWILKFEKLINFYPENITFHPFLSNEKLNLKSTKYVLESSVIVTLYKVHSLALVDRVKMLLRVVNFSIVNISF